MGGGGITSLSSIEMDPSGIILFNGVSTQWIQGTAAGVEINAQTGGAIDLKINNGIEYFFNATQFNAGNKLIKAVLTPVDGTDAANKSYVDNLVNGLAWKDSARATTTANITLSAPQTIDTVSVIAGDRVLVKDQTLPQENGLYDVNAGAWTRTVDADTESDLLNMSVFIQEGAVNGSTGWTLTTPAPITVGTTPLNYAQIGATPSNPLTTKGDLFGYDTGNNRVPVGTNNQLLVANSVAALGVSYTLINDVNLNPGTFNNITGLPGVMTFETLNVAAILTLTPNRSTPATGNIGDLIWQDNDSISSTQEFARIRVSSLDVTSGSEDATMTFRVVTAGTISNYILFNSSSSGEIAFLRPLNMFNNAIIDAGGITMQGNIDVNSFQVDNVNVLNFDDGSGQQFLANAGGDLRISVNTARVVRFRFNGTDKLTVDETEANFQANNIVGVTNITLTGNIIFPDNIRQTFNPGAANAGLNFGSQAGDPSTTVPGDVWYNSTTNKFRANENSVLVDMIAGGGGAQTPWTSDIDADGFDLTDLSNIQFRTTTGAPGVGINIFYLTNTMKLDVPGNADIFQLRIGAAQQVEYEFRNNTLNMTGNGITNPGNFLDANNNELLTWTTLASAVNYFDITNSTTGNGPIFATEGGDVNVDMRLLAKGFLDGSVYVINGVIKLQERSTPTAPGATFGKLYVKDISGRSHLFIQDDVGEVDLQVGAEVVTWTADHNQAGFDLVGKATNGITIGQGATDVLSITYLDDTVGAGLFIGNTDGNISITNESAVVGDNQIEFLMSSGGATTIQNVMRFEIPVAEDSGIIPVLRLDFQDDAGGGLTRPFLQLTSGATEFLRIASNIWTFQPATTLNDLAKINITNATTTAAADRVINLDAADKITWNGAAVGTPNYIEFSGADAFRVAVNNVVQFQVTGAQVDYGTLPITGAGSLAFTGATTSTLDGDASGIIIDSITRTLIQVNNIDKYSFDGSFLDMGGLNIRNLAAIRGDLIGTNEILTFSEVASALNEFNMVNAITGVGPTLSSQGTDANIDFNILPKGTGQINLLGDVVVTKRFQGQKGADVASATTINPQDGNYFDITGTATINHMAFLGWQAGSVVILQFDAAATVAHNTGTDPANTVSFFLAGAVNFVATADDTLTVIYDGGFWRELARSIN